MLRAILLLLLSSICVGAANHCVRSAASGAGTGANWTDAYTDIPDPLVRGDTYYLAAGSYGSHTFNAVSGTSFIYLKKATIAAHGTDTGWSDSYASGEALFSASGTVWQVRLSYFDVDGVTGTGTDAHGIHLSSSTGTDGVGALIVPNGFSASHFYVRHVEMNNAAWGNSNGSRVYTCMSTTCTDQLFQYCYFHGGRVWISWVGGNSDIVAEYCYFKDAGSDDPLLHSAGVVTADMTNFTLRYSVLENMMGVANTTYIEPQFTCAGIYVYGNVIRGTSVNEAVGQGVLAITSSDTATDVRFYNNTAYGLRGAFSGIWGGNVIGSQIFITNNVWQNCLADADFHDPGGAIFAGNNVVNSPPVLPLVNPSTGNFHLSAHTDNGSTLASPYDHDPDGVLRGSGGVWDFGAYQFVSAGAGTGSMLSGMAAFGGNAVLR